MNSSLQETVQAALRNAGDGGAVEVSGSLRTDMEVIAFKGAVAEYVKSKAGAWSVRALSGERIGTAYTEKNDSGALAETIAAARRNARFMDEDPGNGLSENQGEAMFTIGEADAMLSETVCRDLALGLDRRCQDLDSRIVNVPKAVCGCGEYQSIVATSGGLYRELTQRFAFLFAYVVGSEGEKTESGMHVSCVRSFSALDVENVARATVQKTLDLLGGREPESGNYPCILAREAASGLIGAFLGNLDAEAMQKGMSKLAGKQGQKLGSVEFTLIDDPAAPGFGKAPFDDEGVDASKLVLFDQGVFVQPLYTIYSARKDGVRSNGRGFRPSAKSPLRASAINAFIPNGDASFDGLVSSFDRAIVVTELHGLHAGLNPVSGDFSCSAKGFAIRSGKKDGALRNFTISGNFYDLIQRIQRRADDRRLDTQSHFSSPSLAVESLAVSAR
jgi:PmbA protein